MTNGIGGFACGTLAGTLTRRYHGLLVAALKPPLGRTLLLAKLDATADYDGRSYSLSANRWGDGGVDPHGYSHIESFCLEGTTPVWSFALGDALLEKRLWMQPGVNTTYVRYTLLRASPEAGHLRSVLDTRRRLVYQCKVGIGNSSLEGGSQRFSFLKALQPSYVLRAASAALPEGRGLHHALPRYESSRPRTS